MDSNDVPPKSPPPPPPPPLMPLNPPPLGNARPQKNSGGRGWMVLALVLLVFLLFSMLMNFSQMTQGVSGARHRAAGPRLDETILEDNGASDKVAVVDLDGIITSQALDQTGLTMVDLIKAQLERAKEDSNVKAVVLRVDSPGGEVLASDEIYRIIGDFQEETEKPVVASMGNLAASGGYYVSAACRWIVANELTITGSIGVIMSTWNYRGLMEKVGLQPQIYKSGKYKDMLSGHREPHEIPAEERAMVQSLIDETYDRFKEVVAEGRSHAGAINKDAGRQLSDDWTTYADGRVLSGTQAFEIGLVDQLGNFQDAVTKAASLVGISDPKSVNIVRYQQRYSLADFLGIFGASEAKSIKVDLGIDVPKLQAGQLYFLAPTVVP